METPEGMRVHRVSAVVRVVLGILISVGALACGGAPAQFDFDDGTTQGWQASAVYDDKGVYYYPPPVFQLVHNETAQHPSSFPMGDPQNDNKGCLYVDGGQLGLGMSKAGFPQTSTYWGVDVGVAGLDGSAAWQNIKGFKASLGDNFGMVPGHIKAALILRVDLGGSWIEVAEKDASGKPVFHPISKTSWTNISASHTVPAGGKVYQVVVRIRGDWNVGGKIQLYEGGICIDQVAPIK